MSKLVFGYLYGQPAGIGELDQTVEDLKNIGMSNKDIQDIIDVKMEDLLWIKRRKSNDKNNKNRNKTTGDVR